MYWPNDCVIEHARISAFGDQAPSRFVHQSIHDDAGESGSCMQTTGRQDIFRGAEPRCMMPTSKLI